MKISKKSQYGLRAIVYLAKCKPKVCSLKEISEAEGISFDFLEKIISELRKAGFVKAKRGVKGGYYLTQKPEKINIGEIIKVLEGEIALVKCTTPRKSCPREKKCLAKNFWEKFQNSLNSALKSMTLADLIKNEKL